MRLMWGLCICHGRCGCILYPAFCLNRMITMIFPRWCCLPMGGGGVDVVFFLIDWNLSCLERNSLVQRKTKTRTMMTQRIPQNCDECYGHRKSGVYWSFRGHKSFHGHKTFCGHKSFCAHTLEARDHRSFGVHRSCDGPKMVGVRNGQVQRRFWQKGRKREGIWGLSLLEYTCTHW